MKASDQAKGEFEARHIGPGESDIGAMLKLLDAPDLEQFLRRVIPANIRSTSTLKAGPFEQPLSERAALEKLRSLAAENKVFRSLLGMGYHGTITPPVIQRNILENPGWYTQYTPYQPEISQGRLEALLNFQTMVCDLTGLPVSNASLLDEATAAAEAMTMSLAVSGNSSKTPRYLVSNSCHPQTIAVIRTRASVLGIDVDVAAPTQFKYDSDVFGILLQYPGTLGDVSDLSEVIADAHSNKAIVTVAADILALAILKSPGEMGADIAVGSTQRFGVPIGFGGPHAAYFATKDEYKRSIPGRIVGISKDREGRPALRLALQTREQHIRREKATSNICTAQVLLAVMAGMYAVYHGASGIKSIAERVHSLAGKLAGGLKALGTKVLFEHYFDTIAVEMEKGAVKRTAEAAAAKEYNLRVVSENVIALSLDELSTDKEVEELLQIFSEGLGKTSSPPRLSEIRADSMPPQLRRASEYLTHEVFSRYRSETEFLRYVRRLESRDLSLTTSMIPLGSCTMKLNATSEMFPVSWPSINALHPFVPAEQCKGYAKIFAGLEQALADLTGFDCVSLQPNAGSQGEYAGLLAIRAYLDGKGEKHRSICLIPKSAHGTNPASAVMVGMRVVPVECDAEGNVDLSDLRAKLAEHGPQVAALMVTYPSTHGVFEESIKEICSLIHQAGGQVYMDGANLNALVGLVKPGELGADVCHINLHKTFCIPHGGGGPGMGPIAAAKHLLPYMPSHPLAEVGGEEAIGPVSAAPWGSASILVISWMYCCMMGTEGLKRASSIAILNANYIAARLSKFYPVLYRGGQGYVAHECILDLRGLKKESGVEVEDVAKRLMDYGFHAPTVSFPVAGTLMVEPTESESKQELDDFCDALIAIWHEIKAIEKGEWDKSSNPLKNAPHTAGEVCADEWNRPYSRTVAAYPTERTRAHKFWPSVSRIDGVYGDRNLICSCS